MPEEQDSPDSGDSAGGTGSSTGGAGGGGTEATPDMLLEKMLSTVTGVEDSGLDATLVEASSGSAGWITSTNGGPDRDAWSPNLYYGYYGYEANERYFELIPNPESITAFNASLESLEKNIAKVRDDIMPGLSAKMSRTAAALFKQYSIQVQSNETALESRYDSMSAEDSAFKGKAAQGLLANIDAQRRTFASIRRQLYDHGTAYSAMDSIADAVSTFSSAVNEIWLKYRPSIISTLNQTRNAILRDIHDHIEAGDKAWRDKGNNGMSKEEARRVLGLYTWANRGGLPVPEGFEGASGDLLAPSTFDAINLTISKATRGVLAQAAAEVYAAQQTLATSMQTSMRAIDAMVDPVAKPDIPTPDSGDGTDIDINDVPEIKDPPEITDPPDGGDGTDIKDPPEITDPPDGGDGTDIKDPPEITDPPDIKDSPDINAPPRGGDGTDIADPPDVTDGPGGGRFASGDDTGGDAPGGDDVDRIGGNGFTTSVRPPTGGFGAGNGPGGGGPDGLGSSGDGLLGDDSPTFGDNASGQDDIRAAGGPSGAGFFGSGAGGISSGRNSSSSGNAQRNHGESTAGDGAGVWDPDLPDVDTVVGSSPDTSGGTPDGGFSNAVTPSGDTLTPRGTDTGSGFDGSGSGFNSPHGAPGTGFDLGGTGNGSGSTQPGIAASTGDAFGGVDAGQAAGFDPGDWRTGDSGSSDDGFVGVGTPGDGFGGGSGHGAGFDPAGWTIGGNGDSDALVDFGGTGGSRGNDFDFAAGGGAGSSTGGAHVAAPLSPGGGGFSPSSSTGGGIDESGLFGDQSSTFDSSSVPHGSTNEQFGPSGSMPLGTVAESGVGAGGGMGGGMPMMPMMPGAQQNKDRDRERNTWLAEDSDVWGTTNANGNGVIGLAEENEEVRPTHVPAGVAAGRAPLASPRRRTTQETKSEGASATDQGGS